MCYCTRCGRYLKTHIMCEISPSIITVANLLLLLLVNLSELRISEEIKILGGLLAEDYFDLEIATILELSRSFVFMVRRKLESTRFHEVNNSCSLSEVKLSNYRNSPVKSMKILRNWSGYRLESWASSGVWIFSTIVKGRSWWVKTSSSPREPGIDYWSETSA